MLDIVVRQINNAELILKSIKQCDNVFEESIVSRIDFTSLFHKICEYSIFLVAYVDEEIAGYLAFYANDLINKVAFITLLAVKSKYQNKHIGKKLIEMCELYAKNNGMLQIKLEVLNQNNNAIRFYKRNGYIFEGICSDNSQYMKKFLIK